MIQSSKSSWHTCLWLIQTWHNEWIYYHCCCYHILSWIIDDEHSIPFNFVHCHHLQFSSHWQNKYSNQIRSCRQSLGILSTARCSIVLEPASSNIYIYICKDWIFLCIILGIITCTVFYQHDAVWYQSSCSHLILPSKLNESTKELIASQISLDLLLHQVVWLVDTTSIVIAHVYVVLAKWIDWSLHYQTEANTTTSYSCMDWIVSLHRKKFYIRGGPY